MTDLEHTKEQELLERLAASTRVEGRMNQPQNVNPSILFSLNEHLKNSGFYQDAQRTRENQTTMVGVKEIAGKIVTAAMTVTEKAENLKLFVSDGHGTFSQYYGYTDGKITIAALENTKVKQEDMQKEITRQTERRMIEKQQNEKELQSEGFGYLRSDEAEFDAMKEYADGGEDRDRALGYDDEAATIKRDDERAREIQEKEQIEQDERNKAEAEEKQEKEEAEAAKDDRDVRDGAVGGALFGAALFGAGAMAAVLDKGMTAEKAPEFTTDFSDMGREHVFGGDEDDT